MTKKIEGFEDLDTWVRSRELGNSVCRVIEEGKLRRNPALQYQMQRAAVSVISNVGEGFNRSSVKERMYFFGVAKGSVGELRAQSYLAGDRRYITEEDSTELLELTDRCARLLAGLMRYLGTVPARGAATTPDSTPTERRRISEAEIEYLATEIAADDDDRSFTNSDGS